ncbi:cysteine isoform A [Micractinium conductrix]|uniref:Cysteine isoform A n=1 Tax=Micractinium conductrix TaxID=554055 RepID=A0A2P6VH52_9CHLO|nr:cysteine isoform A [Micractinium conductrix]|eukprot:PSC73419.1 cysteine isoform A [Micractinium conductrix]
MPVRDQGEQCKACWAFAATAAIESKLLIAAGLDAASSALDLSEQQLIDCASKEQGYISIGCKGGDLLDPFLYASRSGKNALEGWLTNETAYPYTAATGTLRAAVLKQPVVLGFYMGDSLFDAYAGEVWRAVECPGYPVDATPNYEEVLLDHALLVVGFNMTASPPYWEGSYGTCGMYGVVLAPTNASYMSPDAVARKSRASRTFLTPLYNNLPLDRCVEFTSNPWTETKACGYPAEPGLVTFTSPRHAGLPVDHCRAWSISCNEAAATAYCRLQGLSDAVDIGGNEPSPVGKTSYMDVRTFAQAHTALPLVPSPAVHQARRRLSTLMPTWECASNCKAFSYITCGRAAGFAACDVSRRLFGYELTGGSSVAGPLAAASHFDCCAFCSASSECTGWTWEAVGSSGSCYLKSGSWTEAATRRNSMVSGNWAPQGMPAVLATENIVSFAHCSAGQVITGISNPFFGAGTTNASTSFAVITGICVGKPGCAVRASNDLFGDPKPGQAKSLSFSLSCGLPSPPPPPPAPTTAVRFAWPLAHGRPVDNCWGYADDFVASECGGFVAHRWCLHRGFASAAFYEDDVDAPGGVTRFERYSPGEGCSGDCNAFRSIACAGTGYATCSITRRLFGIDLVGGDVLAGPLTATTFMDCCATCSANGSCTGWTWVPDFHSGNIIDPLYGASLADSANVSSVVSSLCVGESGCTVRARSDLFGDPSPTQLKRLSFAYTCAAAVYPEAPIRYSRASQESSFCVMPEGGASAPGTKAVVSQGGCGHKYVMLPHGAIRHQASGLCLQPPGGTVTPTNGTLLVHDTSCADVAATKFDT